MEESKHEKMEKCKYCIWDSYLHYHICELSDYLYPCTLAHFDHCSRWEEKENGNLCSSEESIQGN